MRAGPPPEVECKDLPAIGISFAMLDLTRDWLARRDFQKLPRIQADRDCVEFGALSGQRHDLIEKLPIQWILVSVNTEQAGNGRLFRMLDPEPV